MIEELRRHNYAPSTQRTYVAQIARLAEHFGTSPDRLTRQQLDEFQEELIRQGVSWSLFNQAVAAMRFFYVKTLKRDWEIKHVPFPKRPKRLPVVLTLEEVARLLAATHPPKVRMLLTTMYGCGLRVSEATRLRLRDIDSQRMLLHIRQSKGRKDRYVPLAATWKGLQAKIGFFAILHTWGQKLDLHPHLHCVVPAGGLSLDQTRWVRCPRGFFLPVKILSRLFRGKFLAMLKTAHRRGELTLEGRLQSLASPRAFNSWLTPLYQKEWVVYAKPPWNGPQHVLKYLARYTHRVAIANQRLQSIDGGQVTFRYKDYRHPHRQRTMRLPATEFIRRFMMHVLPSGFMRIRYFGFLANTHRRQQLEKIRQLLDIQQPSEPSQERAESPQDLAPHQQEERCPHCNRGTMRPIEIRPRPQLSQIIQLPVMAPT
jgi:hypothetical protein